MKVYVIENGYVQIRDTDNFNIVVARSALGDFIEISAECGFVFALRYTTTLYVYKLHPETLGIISIVNLYTTSLGKITNDSNNVYIFSSNVIYKLPIDLSYRTSVSSPIPPPSSTVTSIITRDELADIYVLCNDDAGRLYSIYRLPKTDLTSYDNVITTADVLQSFTIDTNYYYIYNVSSSYLEKRILSNYSLVASTIVSAPYGFNSLCVDTSTLYGTYTDATYGYTKTYNTSDLSYTSDIWLDSTPPQNISGFWASYYMPLTADIAIDVGIMLLTEFSCNIDIWVCLLNIWTNIPITITGSTGSNNEGEGEVGGAGLVIEGYSGRSYYPYLPRWEMSLSLSAGGSVYPIGSANVYIPTTILIKPHLCNLDADIWINLMSIEIGGSSELKIPIKIALESRSIWGSSDIPIGISISGGAPTGRTGHLISGYLPAVNLNARETVAQLPPIEAELSLPPLTLTTEALRTALRAIVFNLASSGITEYTLPLFNDATTHNGVAYFASENGLYIFDNSSTENIDMEAEVSLNLSNIQYMLRIENIFTEAETDECTVSVNYPSGTISQTLKSPRYKNNRLKLPKGCKGNNWTLIFKNSGTNRFRCNNLTLQGEVLTRRRET